MNAAPPPALFLGANTPWVYALASALSEDRSVAAVAVYDRSNYRRLRPSWPEGPKAARLEREFWVFLPGYAGRLEPLLRPWFRRRVRGILKRLIRVQADCQPWTVVPYPWFGPALGRWSAKRIVYYNLDDYVLYHPARRARILAQEADLVARARWTLCLSHLQTERLRARLPAHAKRILHFPLGVTEAFLNPAPESPPAAGTVGYVGNLGDRVDWELVCAVAAAVPQAKFVFVGGLEDGIGSGRRADWLAHRKAALALPNVRHAGKVAQEAVIPFYWQSAVNWIPYATDHPFNEAACPTKIMDAIAAGRPVFSTGTPECRLYPEWITVADRAENLAAGLRRALATAPDAARSRRQVDFARGHTWTHRAEELRRRLADVL